MRLRLLFLLLRACIVINGKLEKVYDFLDYKAVPEKDSGFLTLRQDEANPIILPPQYTLCARVFKWYDRSTYTSFGTISLLDEEGNVTHQYYHGVRNSGTFHVNEYHKTFTFMAANSGSGQDSISSFKN